jgi:indolepyruvate ferredoxin oxidoreductase beta subunit
MISEYNIALAGVGGMGVLVAANLLAEAAVRQGENVRVGEIHGLAQRGGVVRCDVRIGDKVFGPIIMNLKANVLLSFELAETLRSLKKISPEGTILINNYKMIPPGVSARGESYPDEERVLSIVKNFTKNIFILDALKLAQEAGDPRTMNIVMVGAVAATPGFPLKKEFLKEAIAEYFPKAVETNLNAFNLGYHKLALK